MASLSFSGSAKKRRDTFSTSRMRPSSIAVADQIEEAHASGRFPEVFQETCALRRMAVESAKVEGGQGLGLDGDRHGSLLDDR